MKRTIIFISMLLSAVAAQANNETKLPSSINFNGIEIPIEIVPVGQIKALNNISYDLPIYNKFATPSINQENVAHYLNTLFSTMNEGNFRWGHALTYYVMNHTNATSDIIIRYVKTMMAKAHQLQISLPEAQTLVDADINELGYILTGNKETAISFNQWHKEWAQITNVVMSAMPTADAFTLAI